MTLSDYPSASPSTAPLPGTLSEAVPPVDLVGGLYTLLVDSLPVALDGFCKQPLAKFQWKSRAASGAVGQLDVSLEKVNRSAKAGAAQLRLDFQCTPKSGTPVLVEMTVAPFRLSKQGTLHYRVTLGGGVRHWQCAINDDGELIAESGFARPKGLAALEHLGTVWFGNQQDATKHGIAAGVERVDSAMVHPLLGTFWPRFNLAVKTREWGLARAPEISVGDALSINADEWAASVLVFCLWTMLLRTLTEPDEAIPFDELVNPQAKGLPPAEFYWPRRSVDLTAPDVQHALQQEGLVIPWHVIEASCAALNAGKHVIFTGPPGCGKSKLSGVLASLATGREPLMVTASPAWTSGDLIGRYFPRRDGNGLEFRPGFFLRVIDEGNRWLVIDEFNRANIDECFGELFSVLADDVVELPFDEELGAKTGDAGVTPVGAVRIVPARRGARVAEASATHASTVDYAVGPAFRLIGTMNDADRSNLHQLSFALLRRFHIIRVEAPAAAEVERIIDTAIKRAREELVLDTLAYRLTRKGKQAKSLALEMVTAKLKELFARDLTKRKTRTYTDLVQERVVGLATVQDIIRFVAEGIRGSSQGKDANQVQTDQLNDDVKLEEHAQGTCASFLAIGLALSVFPQLDALTPDMRRAAVKHIIDVFQPKDAPPILMRRVEAAGPESEAGLRLALIEHTDPTEYDVDHDRHVSIAEFLVEELCQHYRGTEEARDFSRLLGENTAETLEP